MKKLFVILALILTTSHIKLFSRSDSGIEVFLLTCAPGTETYSIYGHSALRITIPQNGSDMVYNWGVFDFSTPNFVWKFAKGRLDYMLGAYPFERFLQEYFIEKRAVYQQKINLEPEEVEKLIAMISENLKPENVKYRYDFFYDDCSTRIRDLLEKSVGEKLIYPPAEKAAELPSFRDKVGQYQQPFPWLNFGVDLLMGIPADKKASFRDVMFLPIDMQEGLSEAVVNRSGKMIPLLKNPQTILEFDAPEIKPQFYLTPIFIFSIVLIGIILFSAIIKTRVANKTVDLILFSLFSILSLMMIFFNFFTDHQQMKWNLNIIWLSPFVLLCLADILLNKKRYIWFRIVFVLCLVSFIIQIIFPHGFNNAFIPLVLILMLRSSARAGFSWNPLSAGFF